MQITKTVTFIAKDDSIEELKSLLKTMVEPSKNENGCLLYDIFQVQSEPTRFIVIESWENNDALEGHKHTAHYKHYKANFEQYCAHKSSDDLEIL